MLAPRRFKTNHEQGEREEDGVVWTKGAVDDMGELLSPSRQTTAASCESSAPSMLSPRSNHTASSSLSQWSADSEGSVSRQSSQQSDVPAEAIAEPQRRLMFEMYARTYSEAGEELWFESTEMLFAKYPSFIVLEKDGVMVCFLLYQYRANVRKISLLCHDGTRPAKKALMGMVSEVLREPGWILEGSGAVSWVLRSRHGAPVVRDEGLVRRVLDLIRDTPAEALRFNRAFDYGAKASHQYSHVFVDADGSTFTNDETLFGTPPPPETPWPVRWAERCLLSCRPATPPRKPPSKPPSLEEQSEPSLEGDAAEGRHRTSTVGALRTTALRTPRARHSEASWSWSLGSSPLASPLTSPRSATVIDTRPTLH